MTNIDYNADLNLVNALNTTLMSISDRIRYLPANHDTDRPILGAISGSKKTIIVDSGNSSDHARLFLKELSNHRIPQPEFVAITHWHWDHIFGIHEMNLPTIAHIKTKEKIEEMVDYEWDDKALEKRVEEGVEIPFCADMIKKEFALNRDDIRIAIPDILFESKLVIDLGELTCIIENVGGDHSKDSSIVFIPEEKVLFLGDCLAPDLYCEKWKYKITNRLSLIDKIESYDADIYVESHGKPSAKAEFRKELDELRKVALKIQNSGIDINEITQNLTKELNRELNEEDLETIEYFLNGLEEK